MQLTHSFLALALLTTSLANPITPQGASKGPKPVPVNTSNPVTGPSKPFFSFLLARAQPLSRDTAQPVGEVEKRADNFSRFSSRTSFPTNTRPTSKSTSKVTIKPTGIIPTGISKRAVVSVPTGPPRFSIIPTATPKFPNTTISASTKSNKNGFTTLNQRAIFGTAPTVTGTGKVTIKPTKTPKPSNGTVTSTSSFSKSTSVGNKFAIVNRAVKDIATTAVPVQETKSLTTFGLPSGTLSGVPVTVTQVGGAIPTLPVEEDEDEEE
ncbi:hypothetical protein BGZ60DRAFT_552774 [Tricladium varicosporioides]|nr:hypothetical protein BGZ60DRAFT_552774 [Hymenoscyphus varicosporioides]